MQNELEKQCLTKGVKLTSQRRVILRVISNGGHLCADEVWRNALCLDHGISLPTVYRALDLFAAIGILDRLDFQDGRARYELRSERHHHHLIDVKTNKVIEFSDSTLEKAKERIARSLGYTIVAERLELYGVKRT